MARPLRIQYPGAWYHVMNRGGSRRVVFRSDADRALLLAVLAEACEIHGLEVHGYCLMPNHYHFLVRTPRGDLARSMRHIDGVFTQRVNRRHGADGALFRGRYRSILIDADAYLLAVSRYIHLNPVAAALADSPAEFAWSSYNAYAGSAARPAWLHVAEVLDLFGGDDARRRYRSFVAEGVESSLAEFYANDTSGPVLGSERFIESLVEYRPEDPEIPQRRALEASPALDDVLDAVAQAFAVPVATLLRGHRRNDARAVAISLCRRPGGHDLRAISARFGLSHYSAVTVACRRLTARMRRDTGLAARYELALTRLLSNASSVKT